jgi:predicted transcriptional regulator
MNIEEVFSSRIRMKILKIMSNVGELNATEIARRLRINFVSASKHMRVLEDEGILQHKMFGRIRLYRFNEQSSKAKAVQNLIDVWEQETESGCHSKSQTKVEGKR